MKEQKDTNAALQEICDKVCDRDIPGALIAAAELFEHLNGTNKDVPEVFRDHPVIGTMFYMLGLTLTELVPWSRKNPPNETFQEVISEWYKDMNKKTVRVGDGELEMTMYSDPYEKSQMPGETLLVPMILRIHADQILAAMVAVEPENKDAVMKAVYKVLSSDNSDEEYSTVTMHDVNLSLEEAIAFSNDRERPTNDEDLH